VVHVVDEDAFGPSDPEVVDEKEHVGGRVRPVRGFGRHVGT
jgi:hypothetical protein